MLTSEINKVRKLAGLSALEVHGLEKEINEWAVKVGPPDKLLSDRG